MHMKGLDLEKSHNNVNCPGICGLLLFMLRWKKAFAHASWPFSILRFHLPVDVT